MRLVDADSLHPKGNVDKMAAGLSLDDDGRRLWLHAVAAEMAGGEVVVAFSARERRHRDRRAADLNLKIVFLRGAAALLLRRMSERAGHVMPASLRASQLAALQPPTPEERPIEFDIVLPPEALVDYALRSRPASTQGGAGCCTECGVVDELDPLLVRPSSLAGRSPEIVGAA